MSHLSGINKSDIEAFRTSCLGSGPINHTIDKLEHDDHDDEDIWNLYIWELDKYVHVESISGVPYRRIRNIGTNTNDGNCIRDFYVKCSVNDLSDRIPVELVKDIAKLLLKKNAFTFTYYQGHYSLGMSFVDAVMNASNIFIEHYNNNPELRKAFGKDTLYSKGVMEKLVLKGDIFYRKDTYNVPIEALVNTEMFTFKGKPVICTLRDYHTEYTAGDVHIISIDILSVIVYNILKFINANYGRAEDITNKKTRVF